MADDDDLDDLLGPEPGAAPEPEAEPAPRTISTRKPKGGRTDAQVVQRLYQPVSISFIAEVTGRDRKAVTRRLANAQPIAYHRGQTPLYDFRQALEVVVEPRIDAKTIEKRLKSLSASDLPNSLQKDVWDALLKKQKWMQQAGELWATEDVLEVFAEAFQRIKTTAQLWVDQLSDSHDLPEKARLELTEMVDALQADIHQALVEMPKERATLAQAAQLGDDDGV